MGNYREIHSENYIGYILNQDVKMYSAAYHIIKKGNIQILSRVFYETKRQG